MGEIVVADVTYVFEDGAFFSVERDFLNGLNQDILRLGATDIPLPSAGPNEKEGDYNERASSEVGDFLLLDKDLVRFAGLRDGVELCDLLTSTRQFVHVKSYSGSATLSHLFNQARTSADLLQTNGEFRRAAKEKVEGLADGNAAFEFIREEGIQPNEIEVAVAIMKRWDGADIDTLPFFAKLNLRNVASELIRRNFVVKVCKIDRQAGE